MKTKLEIFVAIVTEGSFTKAAQALCVTQPLVTHTIKELENEYKVILFNRGARRATLTPEGEMFYKHARRILQNYSALNEDMSYLGDGELDSAAEFTIGATPSLAYELIPKLIAKYQTLYTKSIIHLKVDSTMQLLQMVADGRCCACFTEKTLPGNYFSNSRKPIEIPLLKYSTLLAAGQKSSIDNSSSEAFFNSAKFISGYNELPLPRAAVLDKFKTAVETSSFDSIISLLLYGGSYCAFLPSYIASTYIGSNMLKEIKIAEQPEELPGEVKFITIADNLKEGYLENLARFSKKFLLDL